MHWQFRFFFVLISNSVRSYHLWLRQLDNLLEFVKSIW
jgi:hypothetical protein